MTGFSTASAREPRSASNHLIRRWPASASCSSGSDCTIFASALAHVRMWINAPLYSTRWARISFAALLRTHGHRAITPYCSRTRMASDWRSISFRVRVCSRREHSFAPAQQTWVEAEAACSPRGLTHLPYADCPYLLLSKRGAILRVYWDAFCHLLKAQHRSGLAAKKTRVRG